MSQIINIATELLAWGEETAFLYRTTNELIYNNLSGHLNLLSAYMYRLADEPSPGGGVSSFNTRVGDVVLLYDDVIDALGFVPLSSIPTLDQVTTAGNTTLNSIIVGTITGNSGISQFKFNTGAGTVTPTLAVGNTNVTGKFAGLLAGTVGSEFNFDKSGWFAIAGDTKANYNNNNLGSGAENYYLRIQGSTGNVQINTTIDADYKLDVNGSIRGTSVAVVGGTAAQFLKANGTLDSTVYTPQSRNLSINGVTYDLSADRSWTIITNIASRVQHQVKAGIAINKGQAVYVTSADGTNMIVGLASNATEITSSKTMGILDANVSINGFANVVTEGLLAGLDTTGATAAGDPVWLGTNGNLIYGILNKPYAPSHLVFIGIVTRRNANNGEIFVKVQNGFELDELHNVDARNPNNNDGIFYNSTTQLWEHKQISAVYSTPTLAQVTTAGNTTTNAITVGSLNVGGVINTAATYTNCGLNASVNVTTNGTVIIGFTAKLDPNGWWNSGTKKWSPTISGYYYVALQVRWDVGTLGNQINIQILKNTNTVAIAQDLLPTNTGLTQTTNAILYMNGTTDYLEFSGFTSSTTGEFIFGEPMGNWTFFNVFRIN
jgi:hypothetical protein